MTCYTKLKFIGTVGTCVGDTINTGVAASQTGEHILQLQHLGAFVQIKAQGTQGQVLSFPSKGLNERFEYVGVIYQPDKSPLKFTVDNIEYDGVNFKTTTYIQV